MKNVRPNYVVVKYGTSRCNKDISFFCGKVSLPCKNLYLPIFPNDRAEISAVCLSKLY